MSVADEIRKLSELRDSGALTQDEFERAKARLLGGVGRDLPPGSGVPPINHLRRSLEDRWIAGVCGGLGRFTNTDGWVWRLVFVLAVFCGGVGVLPYILLWIFVPVE
jgi:phage shock protein C